MKNFNRQLDLLQIAGDFLPTFVMTKGKVRGLMEYFLNGFPNRELAWAMFNQGIPESKRSDPSMTWDTLTRDYLKVIKNTLKHKQEAEDIAVRFSKTGNKLVFEPPDGVDGREKRRDRSHTSNDEEKLQAVTWQDPDEESDSEYLDDVEDEGHEGYDTGGYDTAPESDVDHKDAKAPGDPEDDLEPTDEEDLELVPEELVGDEYLHAVTSKDGTLVCFEFARTGKCKYWDKFGKCKYSHAPEDVARFKAAELLGPSYAQRAAKNIVSTYKANTPTGHRTAVAASYSPGHRGTSPGMRAPFRKSGSRGTRRSGRRST